MGTVIGRSAYFTHGVFRVFPNIYGLLVAPSGRCRKSTAIKIGMDILHKLAIEDVKIIGPKVTPEALVQAIYREKPIIREGRIVPTFPDSVTLVYAPELAVFLNQRDFNKDTIPLLTDLYDSPDKWTTSTMTRGEVVLRNVFVSMLGASTLHWLVELVPRSAFGGGFMGRLLIASRETTSRVFPVPTTPSPNEQANLVRGLQEIEQFAGEITWTPSALDWFNTWYKSSREKREMYTDDRTAGYMERKPITLIKLAIIHTIASRLTVSTIDSLEWALNAIECLEDDMIRTFQDISAHGIRTQDTEFFKRLEDFIIEHKYVMLTETVRYMLKAGITATKTREMLASMKEAGTVDARRDQKGNYIYKYIPECDRLVRSRPVWGN